MPIVKVLAVNRGWAASWRTNSAVATLPVCHLGDENRGHVWRSTSACAGRWVIADLEQEYSIDGLGLVGANLSTNASVFFEGASSSGLLSTSTSTSPSAGFGQSLTPWSADRTCCLVWFLSATQSYKHWRVLISDSGNSTEYVQVGVALLSSAQSMGVDPKEMTYQIVDPSMVDYAPSGAPKTYVLTPYTVVTLPHRFLAESLVFGPLQDTARNLVHEDGILSLYSSAPACSAVAIATNIYGRLVESVSVTYMIPELYEGSVKFRESR